MSAVLAVLTSEHGCWADIDHVYAESPVSASRPQAGCRHAQMGPGSAGLAREEACGGAAAKAAARHVSTFVGLIVVVDPDTELIVPVAANTEPRTCGAALIHQPVGLRIGPDIYTLIPTDCITVCVTKRSRFFKALHYFHAWGCSAHVPYTPACHHTSLKATFETGESHDGRCREACPPC